MNELNDDKQDALVAGSGISISGNVISAEGGGGAEYSAGTNIEITTANTINCTLPITTSRDNKGSSILIKSIYSNITNPSEDFINGAFNNINNRSLGDYGSNVVFGVNNKLNDCYRTHALGSYNTVSGGSYNNVFGQHLNLNGTSSATVFGQYNSYTDESSASIGDSGKTALAIGNGIYNNTHNALELRQNGDLYYVDTYDTTTQNYYEKPMLKLQDVIKDLTDRIAALESQLNNN